MKKKIFISKINLKKQKKIYYILIGLALIAFLIGLLFVFLLSDNTLEILITSLQSYFKNKSYNDLNILNILFNNLLIIILVWILGISIIGIPIVVIVLLFKAFILGFSFSSLVYTYKIKGLLISFINLVPHKIIYLIDLILVSFYSISFSLKLFNSLFLKKQINFKEAMNKYIKILIISFLVVIIISLYEAFIPKVIFNFFNI